MLTETEIGLLKWINQVCQIQEEDEREQLPGVLVNSPGPVSCVVAGVSVVDSDLGSDRVAGRVDRRIENVPVDNGLDRRAPGSPDHGKDMALYSSQQRSEEVEEGEVIMGPPPPVEPDQFVNIGPDSDSDREEEQAKENPTIPQFTEVELSAGIAHGLAALPSSSSSSSSMGWKGKGKGLYHSGRVAQKQFYPRKGIIEYPNELLLRKDFTHKTQRAVIRALSNSMLQVTDEFKRHRKTLEVLAHTVKEATEHGRRLETTILITSQCLERYMNDSMQDDSDLSDDDDEEEEEEEEQDTESKKNN